jgi:hypothetical protein
MWPSSIMPTKNSTTGAKKVYKVTERWQFLCFLCVVLVVLWHVQGIERCFATDVVACSTAITRMTNEIEDDHEKARAFCVDIQKRMEAHVQATKVGLQADIAHSTECSGHLISSLRFTTEAKFMSMRSSIDAREAAVDSMVTGLRVDVDSVTKRMTRSEAHDVFQDVVVVWNAWLDQIELEHVRCQLVDRMSHADVVLQQNIDAAEEQATTVKSQFEDRFYLVEERLKPLEAFGSNTADEFKDVRATMAAREQKVDETLVGLRTDVDAVTVRMTTSEQHHVASEQEQAVALCWNALVARVELNAAYDQVSSRIQRAERCHASYVIDQDCRAVYDLLVHQLQLESTAAGLQSHVEQVDQTLQQNIDTVSKRLSDHQESTTVRFSQERQAWVHCTNQLAAMHTEAEAASVLADWTALVDTMDRDTAARQRLLAAQRDMQAKHVELTHQVIYNECANLYSQMCFRIEMDQQTAYDDGEQTYQDASTYKGEQRFGQKHGQGELVFPDGSFFQGTLISVASCIRSPSVYGVCVFVYVCVCLVLFIGNDTTSFEVPWGLVR